ncbi:Secreted protein [Pseudomonas donghuensis]
MDEWQVIEIKREKFIKALFLCLFLVRHLSVDKVLQAFIYLMYRDSKPCGLPGMSVLDKRFKPVDEMASYPQGELSSALRASYQRS